MSYNITRTIDADVAVLGGGGSGMVAAAPAAMVSGKKVVVLEKAAATGGGMVMASTMRTFGSKWQKERGIEDVTDAYVRSAMDLTYWRLDQKLVANTIAATGEFFDWLCSLEDDIADQFHVGKYVFDSDPATTQYGPQCGGPGGHKGGGKLAMEVMLRKCQELGVEVLTSTPVVDCEVADGKITAVIAGSGDSFIKVNCRACVMAIGSWINNFEVMEKICPEFNKAKMEPSAHKNPNYTGDGVALAEKAGAFLDYDSFCLRLMGPMVASRSMVFSNMNNSEFTVCVNKNGKRFVCEPSQTRLGIFDSGHVLLNQPDSIAYDIFDMNNLAAAWEQSKLPQEVEEGGFFMPARYPDSWEGIIKELDEAVAKNDGKAFKADTIAELAEKLGVPEGELEATMTRYNGYCETGMDWDCYKDAAGLVAMDKPPYYACKCTLGTDGAFGGVLVDGDMRAKADNGGVVDGLYVTGDFASGRFVNQGGVKKQLINDMSWAFASGFIAGTNAGNAVK